MIPEKIKKFFKYIDNEININILHLLKNRLVFFYASNKRHFHVFLVHPVVIPDFPASKNIFDGPYFLSQDHQAVAAVANNAKNHVQRIGERQSKKKFHQDETVLQKWIPELFFQVLD